MLFIIFAVVVALLLVVLQFKQYRSFQKQLAEHQQQTGGIPQATAFSALRRVSLLVPVAICAVVALVIVLRPALVNDPQAYLVLLLILGILFSGSSITGNMTQRLYYTPTGFFIKERFVAYNDLKRLVHGGGRKADSIELRDGTTYRLPRRQLQALEELKEQKVFRLAGKKKG